MTSVNASRFGRFVLAGRPNAGKSTLLNRLVGHHLAITSPKPQSTRRPVIGVMTDGPVQMVFVDPPGLMEPTYLLQRAMRDTALSSLLGADGLLWLEPVGAGAEAGAGGVEPENPREILGGTPRLEAGLPSLRVRSKADLVSPSHARSLIAAGVLPISALTGRGIDTLLGWCRAHSPRGPFLHGVEDLSGQPVRFFVSEFVREAAFKVLDQELPYSVAAEVDEFREASEPLYIRVTAYVERESQRGIVVGRGGRTIKRVGRLARERIEALLDRRVYLDLRVKVLPKWRRKPEALRRFGLELSD